MGTEVMLPHDILSSRRLGGVPSTALLPRRRQTPTSSPGSSPNLRPSRRAEPRKRREGSPRPAKNSGGGNGGSSGGLEMGQVTILRRGESLDAKASGTIRGKARKEERRRGAGGAGVLSSVASGDLIVFGTGRIGPDPVAMPKQIRVAEAKTGAKAYGRAEKYAGSAFSTSPSPRALPLPRFSCRRAAECGGGAVDLSATRDLRRLLQLD
ncbi:hypothetical protein Taro_006152 [Colocasia esculenta]|uniref:Uncharacterized protein n=1 Tax=Colocasia esculenta TaxID=4460 RepID=A0A843TWL0_COLES|nr:hypothetical protein [Colocasia esculenta]